MSRNQELSTRGRPDTTHLLNQLLEEPGLVAAIQALPPRQLGRVIDEVGLEDAGELVALASLPQLEQLFDEDLWSSPRPGVEPSFDPARFLVWLEVMLEAGEAFAADRFCELPEELVALALQRQLLVVDGDRLGVELAGLPQAENDLFEKALDSCLALELGQYQVIARQEEGWDALTTLLLAMDRSHHTELQWLLESCCAATAAAAEDEGSLYDLLTAATGLEGEAAGARQERRAALGYVPPADAAAFLTLARQTPLPELWATATPDPITLAFFRSWQPAPVATPTPATDSPGERPPTASPASGAAQLLARLAITSDAADLARPALAPPADASRHEEAPWPFRLAMAELRERLPLVHGRRLQELSYLANLLLAGCSHRGRSLRPVEAGGVVLATCNLGLELRGVALAGTPVQPGSLPDGLGQLSAVKLFRAGWRSLHEQVVQPTAQALEQLARQRLRDHPRLAELLRSAAAARQANRPWLFRPRLSLLAGVVEQSSLATWEGLLDECPAWQPHPPAAPVFIATLQQLELIRGFLARV